MAEVLGTWPLVEQSWRALLWGAAEGAGRGRGFAADVEQLFTALHAVLPTPAAQRAREDGRRSGQRKTKSTACVTHFRVYCSFFRISEVAQATNRLPDADS